MSSTLTAVVHGAAEVVVGPSRVGTADGDGPDGGDGDDAAGGSDDDGGAFGTGDDPLRRYGAGAVAVVDGRVAAVGPADAVTREYPPENAVHAVDADGGAVVPGFVDAHTHALFAGDRSDEFAARLRGRSYEEIAAEGGGIRRTVRAVRRADDDRLLSNLLGHLDRMAAHGTTTVEVKSGYGLDVETELRMLSVIDRADRRHPVDVVPTFMGAHAVPEGLDADEYVDRVVDDQIPAVADQGIAAFCDVFCEEGAFTPEQSRRVLAAGGEANLAPKVHAEELARSGGAAVAVEAGATSADHLLHAVPDDAEAFRSAGVTPVLLPGTAFSLGAAYADPDPFLRAGDWTERERAPLALSTDFNPNCHSHSVPFAVALGCVEMGLSPADATLAATRGGAAALDIDDGRGTLREGAPGDIAVLDGPSHVHLAYQFGVNPVVRTLKAGVPVGAGPEDADDADASGPGDERDG